MITEVKQFKEYLIKQRKDLKTIEAYATDLNLFLEYNKKPIRLIDEFDIEKYKAYLLNDGYRLSSVNRKIVAINVFMKFYDHNLRATQEKVQMQNFLDNVIESDEFTDIIGQAEHYKDYRAKALLCTMFYTGMRISECLQLKITDVDKDTILIRGKGKKYRNVFIPDKLKIIWQEYLPTRINKTEMLFTGKHGAITRRYSNEIFKKYALLAGIDTSKAHNHNLRHLYCRKMVENNVDISTIADLVGHSDINITRRYLVKSKKQLLEIINNIE